MAPTFLRNLNIGTRLLLLCLAVATPLMAMCGFVIFKEYQGLAIVARRATTYHDRLAVRTVEQWIATQQAALGALAQLPQIQQLEASPSRKLLFAEDNAASDCQAIALYDTSGKLIATSYDGNASNWSEQTNFLQSQSFAKPQVSGYTLCPLTGRPAILLSQPVQLSAKRVGVLVESLSPAAILKLFSGLNQATGFVVSVVDADNKVIARTLDNDRWQGKDFSHAKTVTAAQQANKGTIEVVGIADPTPRTYAFERVPSTGWLIIVGIPTESIYGSAQERLLTVVICSLVALAMAAFGAWVATKNFTRPIHELVREAVAIGRGDLSKRVPSTQGGELGLLARAFNEMALRLELNREHKAMIERISESVRQSLDIHEILNTAVSELGQAVNASRCCLALVENAGQNIVGKQLEFNYLWYNDKLNGTALKNRSIMITHNSILKIILDQAAILSLDVMDDDTFTPLFEQAEESPEDWRSIKSLIACPILLNQEPIGMILVHQCDRLRVWDEPELELVEAVARHVALALDHGHLYARTREMAEQQFLINQIVRSTRGSLEADTILDTVTRELGTALGVDYCQIAQPRPEGPLVVTHEYHAPGLLDHKGLSLYGERIDFHPDTNREELRSVLGIDLANLPSKAAQGVSPMSVQEAPIAVIPDIASDRRALQFAEFLETVGSRSLLAAPLLQDDRVLGIVIAHQCRQLRSWQGGEVRLIAAVADQLAVAISHAELFETVKHQAITDGLTGLYNHIYFKNRLAEELNRAQRKGSACSLLMLDLDKLKDINDTYGHPVGDAAIRQVAVTLKSHLRSGDTAARYGGEEFAVILPETPLNEAVLIADRLRRNINKAPVPALGHISASVGVASFPEQAGKLEDLVDRADRALYVAKRGGRNRVCVFDETVPRVVAGADGSAPIAPPSGKSEAENRADVVTVHASQSPATKPPRQTADEPAGGSQP